MSSQQNIIDRGVGREGIPSSSTEAAAEKGAIYIGHGVLEFLTELPRSLGFLLFFCWGSTCLVPGDLGKKGGGRCLVCIKV